MSRLVKKAAVAAAVAGLAVALTACGTSPTPAASADKGPLTVWVMGDSGANFEKLIAPFEQSSGIQVDVVAVPWDSIDQKLTTAVASGSGPDVLEVGVTKLRTFADAGALMDITNDIQNYPNLAQSNFPSGAVWGTNGQVLSVPWTSDTRVLFYRSDILQAAGIANPPATWDELRADAKTLAARGKGQYGYYIPQWDNALPVEMTWDFGGDPVGSDGTLNFDIPAFQQAVDLYTGLYADKSVPTNSDFDQTQGFVSGVAPMLVSGPYLAASITSAAPDLAGKWNVATLPSGTTNTSLFAGSNLGVFAESQHKDAALQLLNFVDDPKTQVSWYQANSVLPTATAALSDPSLSSDPLFQVYAKQLANSKALPLVPNWDGATGTDLLAALNSIVLTGADRDSTLQAFYQKEAGVSTK